MRRVVVTGLGIVSACGNTAESFFHNLTHGKSGIRKVSLFDPGPGWAPIAGEVPHYVPSDHFPVHSLDRLDRNVQFALLAGRQAVEASHIQMERLDKTRFGVILGSGFGGAETIDKGYHRFYRLNHPRPHPFVIPMGMYSAATSQLCMDFQAQGPAMTISTACSSSGHAIGQSYQFIRSGMADVMITGGSDAPLTHPIMRAWESLRILARPKYGDPKAACRPFSADRDGLVLAEGAAILMLEELEFAKKRGAEILCELAGYGLSSDAVHLTHPSVHGASRAIVQALQDAKVAPEEVSYLNAHGTATRVNDPIETDVIKTVFKEHAYNLPISSTKSMHGHAMGATGALELVATIMAMKRSLAPPTANMEERDKACDLDFIPNKAREIDIKVAISNSIGFGGLNACLLVKKFA